jgi:microcystin-dependent protein
MPNKKISELTDAGTISTLDEIPLARGGRTYKAKIGLSIVPAGCVMAFAGTTIPEGWLKCNGDAIPNTTGTVQSKTANFSTLYSIIGANLPDLRGYFIRGLDDGRNIDTGRQIRTNQDDAFKLHTHTGSSASAGGHKHTYNSHSATFDLQGGSSGGAVRNIMRNPDSNGQTSSTGDHTHTITIGDSGGTETRPKNVALHYIIKY